MGRRRSSAVAVAVAVAKRWFARKSEAPRAVLPAEASAPPGATPRLEDPPPVDLRALAFVPTNVNRPSVPRPRRAIPFCRLVRPGFPARLPRRSRHAAPAAGCPAADATHRPCGSLLPFPLSTSWPRLALLALRLGTVPRGPVGVALTGMCVLCSPCFPWSRGIFHPHRVLPRIVALVTEVFRSSTVHAHVVHRPDVDVTPICRLNGAVTSFAPLAIIIIC